MRGGTLRLIFLHRLKWATKKAQCKSRLVSRVLARSNPSSGLGLKGHKSFLSSAPVQGQDFYTRAGFALILYPPLSINHSRGSQFRESDVPGKSIWNRRASVSGPDKSGRNSGVPKRNEFGGYCNKFPRHRNLYSGENIH